MCKDDLTTPFPGVAMRATTGMLLVRCTRFVRRYVVQSEGSASHIPGVRARWGKARRGQQECQSKLTSKNIDATSDVRSYRGEALMTELNETVRFPRARFRTKRGQVAFHPPTAPRLGVPLLSTRHPELNAAIEAEIIPRLVMAHAPALERVPAIISASAQEAADFAELVLDADDGRAVACIQSHRDHGETLERIYLELLVPTANHLRHLWADDERDFADVTLALWRLQQLLRHFSPAFCAELAIAPAGLRVLLTTAPGD